MFSEPDLVLDAGVKLEHRLLTGDFVRDRSAWQALVSRPPMPMMLRFKTRWVRSCRVCVPKC